MDVASDVRAAAKLLDELRESCFAYGVCPVFLRGERRREVELVLRQVNGLLGHAEASLGEISRREDAERRELTVKSTTS